jgi:uncharacterized protein YegL
MSGHKIQSLNRAIHEGSQAMQEAARNNPYAEVFVRAIAFSHGARWHVADARRIEDFVWPDLQAEGTTDLGEAFKLLSAQLQMPPMPERALPPVVVLVSDGQPTDDYRTPLKRLLELPWGKKSVRIAIAIGQDADRNCLREFIGHAELPPLEANNPDQLTRFIKWVSTVVVSSVSSPASRLDHNAGSLHVQLPAAPQTVLLQDPNDVW